MSSEPRSEVTLPRPAPDDGRLAAIIQLLREAHPDARCALDHRSPYELLVATILSAQCTDERVNLVTPALFARYPSPEAMAGAERGELEAMIRSTGFYHNKAEFLQEASRRLAAEYGGEVPAEMEKLVELPGVARKTANVVLGVCFGKADGIVVDTHVKRLAGRLGLSAETDPVKIERDLMAIVPREEWIDLAHLLIFHGRRVCHARKPACSQCVLRSLCPSAEA